MPFTTPPPTTTACQSRNFSPFFGSDTSRIAFSSSALFRFPLPLQIRNGLLILGLPVVWFALAFVGGATDQMALPHASAYGALAGILIGGRYWSGPRLGEPRPPFNGPGRRRRRRKRRPKQQKQTQKREKPAVAAAREKQAKDR